MKKKIINYLLQRIDVKYDKELLIYGFEILYLNLTKLAFILMAAYLIGILSHVLFLIFCYGFLKLFSYGVHAAKTSTCLVLSFIFTCLPVFLLINLEINKILLLLMWIIVIIGFWKYAPADTNKKPIGSVSFKKKLKRLSLVTILIYWLISFFVDKGISNILIYVSLLQMFMISPLSYKLLNEKYNNGRS